MSTLRLLAVFHKVLLTLLTNFLNTRVERRQTHVVSLLLSTGDLRLHVLVTIITFEFVLTHGLVLRIPATAVGVIRAVRAVMRAVKSQVHRDRLADVNVHLWKPERNKIHAV